MNTHQKPKQAGNQVMMNEKKDADEQHEEDVKEEMETLLESDNCNGVTEDDDEDNEDNQWR